LEKYRHEDNFISPRNNLRVSTQFITIGNSHLSAAIADYPTTTYQSQSAATQFIDLEKQSLPKIAPTIVVGSGAFALQ
jgi:hypothetical protein